MLLPRLSTSVIGIPLILILLHTGGLPLAVFFAAASLLCLAELFNLVEAAGAAPRRWIGYPAALVMYVVFILPSANQSLPAPYANTAPLLGFALTAFLLALLTFEVFAVKTRSLARSAATFTAVLCVTWPLGHIVLLRELAPLGREWCLFLFITLWVADTAAYTVGTTLGRHKLAPKISPKKTVEGMAGSFLGAVAAASILWLVYFRPAGLAFGETAILGGLALAALGQISDLIESMMKREANVKDSSQLLPGHGGLLDRLDSFLFTAPMMYYYLVLLGRGG